MTGYDYYNTYGRKSKRFYYKFTKRNPEFDDKHFRDYVVRNNRGDRDSGELDAIAAHEVLRLAYEFAEHRWRAPNLYGEENEGLPQEEESQ